MKYILTGLSDYGKRNLSDEDKEQIESLIGSEVLETDELNSMNEPLVLMADNETCSPEFLILTPTN